MYIKHSAGLKGRNRSSEEALLTEGHSLIKSKSGFALTWKVILIHSTVLLLYTIVFLTALLSQRTLSQQALHSTVDINSPAKESIEFTRVVADIDAPSIYKGNPSKKLDDAWENLLEGYNLRISYEALQRMGRQSIPLSDGSGDYWGILDSFHNLHCLKQIRHYLAPEHYPADNHTNHVVEGLVYAPHMEHCIESLRRYVMCKGDVTILTWDWPEEPPQAGVKYYPQTNYSIEHQCVNWPKLQHWAIEHSFHLGPETIFHPKYGYPF